MSTKIYNGFRLKTTSWADAQRLATDFRKKVKVWAAEKQIDFMAHNVAKAIDKDALGEELGEAYRTGRPLSNAWSDFQDRVQKSRERYAGRDFEADIDFQFVLFPVGRQILGVLFTENHEWAEKFWKSELVEQFPYWDNSDKPDSVTAQQWRRRKKLWDLAMPTGIPAESGFMAQCHPALMFVAPKPHEVLAKIPTIAERAHTLAFGRVKPPKPGMSPGEWLDWSMSDEFRALQEVKALEIEKIIPEITIERMKRELGVAAGQVAA